MTSIKAVLFDYDDTLVQTRASKYLAIQALARDFYNYELTSEVISKDWGKSFDLLFKNLFGEIDSDHEQVVSRYKSITDNFPMESYPDAVDTVMALIADKHVGVVTSTSRALIMPDLERLGFPVSDFLLIQTCEDTDIHKPNPEVFKPALLTLANHSIAPEEILYVGDSHIDFLAANGAGLKFAGIPREEKAFEKFKTEKITALDSLSALLDSNIIG
ncbi:MAG: HAD-IA family hydrolase [Deltaproteobacteria bacterium]|nr:HAD-IA family hydrolase [Deltaproteobacteria bacterium]